MVKWEDVCKPKAVGGLGLGYAKLSNLAFMTKIGWNLDHNRDDLWVRVLRSHYQCSTDVIPHVSVRSNCSNLWKGVCEAWKHVEGNLIWRIGNGHSDWFWFDNWDPKVGCLVPHASIPLVDHMLEAKVSDFINSDGGWDWPRLLSILPIDICDFICSSSSFFFF